MSNWFHSLGFTPPVQKPSTPNGSQSANAAAAPTPSPFSGTPTVDKFERTSPLFGADPVVRNTVKHVSTMSLDDMKGSLNPSTFAGLTGAARGEEFPAIEG